MYKSPESLANNLLDLGTQLLATGARRDKIKMNEIPAALGAGSHQLPHDVLRCNANCTCLARANSRCSTLGDHEEESSSIQLKVDTGKLDSPIYALYRTTTTARTQSVTARREDISGMVGSKAPHTIPAHAPRSKFDPTGSMHAQCRHRGDPTLPLRLPALAFDLNFSPGLTPHALKIAYRRPQMRRTETDKAMQHTHASASSTSVRSPTPCPLQNTHRRWEGQV
ncbi:hypothetical protein B0H13DRAFT_1903154 [Mycena leptocephala]|nr:hypothetical protein B0H13DRAFT_1903154 [Mycena leptocephala]